METMTKSLKGSNNPNWKGGKKKNYAGYILVKSRSHPRCDKNGYVFEHRLVMEEYLGRILEPTEIVHHKNGVKNDNRIENLVLMSSISEHQKEHWRNKAHRRKLIKKFKQVKRNRNQYGQFIEGKVK